MDVASGSKRKRDAAIPRGNQSKGKRQKRAAKYHSSSEEEEEEVAANFRSGASTRPEPSAKKLRTVDERLALDGKRGNRVEQQSDDNAAEGSLGSEVTTDDAGESSHEESDVESTGSKRRDKPKRKDPTAFATSISKILSSKLTTTQRNDPVLSRSKAASNASAALAESRVEAKAKRKLKEDKRQQKDNGRIKDVLGLQTPDVSTGDIAEEEKRLRRMAQRGVIKLFNAVRAAQVKGEEAAREGQKEGMIGIGRRNEKVNEMSKKRFLDLLVDDAKS
ncbi:MAG: hypothetical protein M1828_000872 [Chrysothrix sp. TS-e1954]|nr:MAG: hypothetical protein M1828_000872 [Chrysothrix sp. TS-e1954]